MTEIDNIQVNGNLSIISENDEAEVDKVRKDQLSTELGEYDNFQQGSSVTEYPASSKRDEMDLSDISTHSIPSTEEAHNDSSSAETQAFNRESASITKIVPNASSSDLPKDEPGLPSLTPIDESVFQDARHTLATITVPLLPQIDTSLLEPLSPPLTPAQSPHSSLNSSSSSHHNNNVSLSALMLPFTSAYNEQQASLTSSVRSIKRYSESVIKMKEHSKKYIELYNTHTSTISNYNKQLKNKKHSVEKYEGELAKLNNEITEKQSKIDFVKNELYNYGLGCENDTRIYLEQQETFMQMLNFDINKLTEIRDEERNELNSIRNKNIDSYSLLQDKNTDILNIQTEILEYENQIRICSQAVDIELKKRIQIEDSMRVLTSKIQSSNAKKKEKEELVEKLKNEISDYKYQISELNTVTDNLDKELTNLDVEHKGEIDRYHSILESKQEKKSIMESLNNELNEKNVEVEVIKKNKKKLKKEFKYIKDQVITLEHEVTDLEHERADLLNEKTKNEVVIMNLSKEYISLKNKNELIEKEMNILKTQTMKKEDNIKNKSNLINVLEMTNRNLQNEKSQFTNNAVKLQEQIDGLKAEIEGKINEIKIIKLNIDNHDNELHLINNYINKANEQIILLKNKITQQNILCDKLTAERNDSRKKLINYSILIKEYKKNYHLKKKNCEELKIKCENMDKLLKNDFNASTLIVEEQEELNKGINKLKTNITELENEAKHLENSKNNLELLLIDATAEKKVQEGQFKVIESEEKLLQVQVINKKNEKIKLENELNLCINKMKYGFNIYKDLESKIKLIVKEKNDNLELLHKSLIENTNITQLFNDINIVKMKIQNEVYKKEYLSKEKNTHINIHRWRKVKEGGGDKYQMIKLKNLSINQIIQKENEIIKKNNEIKSQTDLYLQLKNMTDKMNIIKLNINELAPLEEELANKREKLKQFENELNNLREKKRDYENKIKVLEYKETKIKKKWSSKRKKQEEEKQQQKNTIRLNVRNEGAERGRGEGGGGEEEKSNVEFFSNISSCNSSNSDSEDENNPLKKRSFNIGEEYDENGNLIETHLEDKEKINNQQTNGTRETEEQGDEYISQVEGNNFSSLSNKNNRLFMEMKEDGL